MWYSSTAYNYYALHGNIKVLSSWHSVFFNSLLQGDHNLAMQILKHEWHKVKEEEKHKVHICHVRTSLGPCAN